MLLLTMLLCIQLLVCQSHGLSMPGSRLPRKAKIAMAVRGGANFHQAGEACEVDMIKKSCKLTGISGAGMQGKDLIELPVHGMKGSEVIRQFGSSLETGLDSQSARYCKCITTLCSVIINVFIPNAYRIAIYNNCYLQQW